MNNIIIVVAGLRRFRVQFNSIAMAIYPQIWRMIELLFFLTRWWLWHRSKMGKKKWVDVSFRIE